MNRILHAAVLACATFLTNFCLLQNRVVLVSLLLLSSPSLAQKILYGNVTVGSYRMSDLKHKQKELASDYAHSGVPVKIISSFPMSLQGEPGMDFTIHDALLRPYHIGGFVNFAVTTARLNYTDYSGSVDLTQDLIRLVLGAKGWYDLMENLDLYGKADYIFPV